MSHARSFEARLEQATTPAELQLLVAELNDPIHPEFRRREQAVVTKAAEDGLTWADLVPAIWAAPFRSTGHWMIAAAATAGKLANLADVSLAVGLIQPQLEGAEQAMIAVRDAAMGMLEVTDQTSADDLQAIVRVAHEFMFLVSPVQHVLLAEAVARRALDFCPNAPAATEFAQKLSCCRIAVNHLLQLSADKLASEGALDVASALQLLRAAVGDDLLTWRVDHHILTLLAPNLGEMGVEFNDLCKLAGFVTDFHGQGEEDPRLGEKAIIQAMLPHTPTVRLALHGALSFATTTGIYGMLTEFVAKYGLLNENAAVALSLLRSDGDPASDELMAAVDSGVEKLGFDFRTSEFADRMAKANGGDEAADLMERLDQMARVFLGA